MMKPEEQTSAKKQENDEKLSEHALGTDEFAFKPKLEMMSNDDQVVVQLPPYAEESSNTPLQNEPQQQNSVINQFGQAMSQVVYPLGEPTLAKSPAAPQVKESMLRKFYSLKPGVFEHAVEDVKRYLNPTIDGKFLSAWLMAEIDHWDHEKERFVILTDTLLVLIKYNFVASRIEDCKRVQLHLIDCISGGRFQYPEKTMMMPRAFQTGIRLSWNKNEVLSRWQRFSPFFNSPSYLTFTQHKAVYYMDDVPTHMKYEGFKEAAISAVTNSGAAFEVALQPIYIEVYVGAMSVIHNSSDLGYSKDRGAASF